MKHNWERLLSVSPDDLPWSDYDDIKKQAIEAQKVISAAQDIISDAATRYKKKKLKARNKAQANDMALRFADLEGYESIEQIRDAYGWEFISEKEMERLVELWELRKTMVDTNGKYSDPVTNLLDEALRAAYAPYINLIEVSARMTSLIEERQKEILRQDIAFEREIYLRGL